MRLTIRHAVAIGAVLLAFILRQLLFSTTGIHLGPFFALFPAVIFSALLLGYWPGISSSLFATLLAYYGIFLPLGNMSGKTASDRASLIIFLIVSIVFSAYAERFRRANLGAATGGQAPVSFLDRLTSFLSQQVEDALVSGPRKVTAGRLAVVRRAFPLILLRTAVALLAFGAGLFLRLALMRLFGVSLPPFLTFFPAILAAALLCGFWSGLLATLLSSGYTLVWIFEPKGRPSIQRSEDAVTLFLFLLIGSAISAVCEGFRRRQRRIAKFDSERAAWENRAKLEAAIESMSEAVFITDADGKLVDANRAFLRRFHSPDAPDGLPTFEDVQRILALDYPEGGSVPLDQQPVVRALRGEIATNQEYKLQHRLTGEAWLACCNFSPILSSGGAIVGAIVSARDITGQRQMQQALHSSEARYRATFQTNIDAIVLLRLRDQHYIDCNDALVGLVGFSRDEIIGSTPHKLQIWVEHAEQLEMIRRLRESGVCREYQARFRRKDGTLLWVLLSAAILEIEGESCVISIVRDVTSVVQSQDALRASEERYRQLFLASQDSLAVTRVNDQTYIEVNEEFLRTSGFTHEEILGKTSEQIGIWADRHERDALTQLLKQSGSCRDYPATFRRKDGEIRKCVLSASLIELSGERCILTVARDVTESLKAEEARRTSEALYRTAFETSRDGIAIFQLSDQKFLDVNAAYVRILGWEREELVGHTSQELGFFVHASERRNLLDLLARDGSVREVTVEMRRKSGEIFFGSFWTTVIDIDGIPCAHAVLRDRTAQRRAEEARSAIEKRYRAAFETSFDGIAVLTIDAQTMLGTYIDVNDRGLDITGLTRQELLGHTPNELGLWTDLAEFDARVEVLKAQGYFQDVEETFRRPDGEMRWILSSGTLLEIDGRPCLLVTFKDITVARQAKEALRASENRYRTAFETSKDAIAIFNQQNQTILDVNAQFVRVFGWSRDELLGHTTIELNMDVSPDDRRKVLDDLAREGAVRDALMPLRRKCGETFWAVLSGAMMEIDGAPCSYITARDVTEQRLAEEALRASENRYRTVFQTSLDPIAIVRASDGIFLEVSHSFLEFTGWNREEVVGHTTADLALWADRHMRSEVNASLDRGEPVVNFQAEFRKKSGESFWGLMTSTRFEMEGESCTLSVIRDLTAARRAEAEIRHLSFFDSLTGLANRRQLDERLKESIESCAASDQHMALLCIDLDNFQTANNAFGHANGDLILRQIAERISDCVHSSDIVARPGGDEYFVFLDRLDANRETAAERVRAITEEIMERVEMPCRIGEHEFTCTCSIGITLTNSRLRSVSELLQQADIAMHQAKEAGRNTFRFFSVDLQEAVSARASLEEDLRQAIKEEQFVLYYQPQVERGILIGVEALVRWQHPRFGLLAPDKFIHLAENTRLILPLGNWVLRTACQQIARWARAFPASTLSVSVNISALQLRQEDFVQNILEVVESTGADPRRLKLELTESMLAENIEDAITKMRALQPRGVSFSLDDFGTGYSSLAYLRRLPLAQLKIDRSFVKDILTDSGSAAIAQTIISLSHALGVPVIAEGVETEEQRGLLAGLGCHAYQGYLFGRPTIPGEIEKRLLK